MPILTPGVVTRSRQPTFLVENSLEAGSWRFRLTVVDDSGLESAASELVVRVVPRFPGLPEPFVPPVGPRLPRRQPTPRPIRRTTRTRRGTPPG